MTIETIPLAKIEEKAKELQLRIEEGEAGVQLLKIPELDKNIPIYDFRNLTHQVMIAKALAKGERMAMFGGVWGAFRAVKRNTTAEDFFHRQVKPGRPWEAKVPLMIKPKDGLRLIDWSQVHSNFRFLSDYAEFKKLWNLHPAFLHIIAPVRPTKHSLPDIFITTPQDYQKRYSGNDIIQVSTVALLHRHDPYLEHLSAWVERFSHTAMSLGVSTLNPHGEEPPYTEKELFEDIKTARCKVAEIDLIVTDRLYEESGAFGSHTQLRLPLVGESPTLKVLRIGSLSIDGFETATGLQCDPPALGIKDVRKNQGENLDAKLSQMRQEIEANWKLEKSKIYFRA